MSPLGTLEVRETKSVSAKELEAQHPELDDLKDTDKLVEQIQAEENGTPAEVQSASAPEVEASASNVHDVIDQVAANLGRQASTPAAPPATTPTPAPTAPQPPTPQPSSPENSQPYTLVTVDRTQDAKKAARAAAEQRLSEETNEGGRLKRVARAVWKTGIAHEWYRQKYIREAYDEIVEQQDVLLKESSNEAARAKAEDFLLHRFRAGFVDKDDGINEKHREQYKELGEESELGQKIRGFVQEAVSNGYNDDEIADKYADMISKARDEGNGELFGSGDITSENVFEVIESMRGAGLHGASLQHAVASMRIISGESRSGGKTEAHYSKADKIIERLAKGGRLGAISPELAASGVALGIGALKLARGTILKAAGLTLPGVTGAVFGGLREAKRTKDDIAQYQREVELGKIFTGKDNLREAIEGTLYDSREATDLIESLAKTADKETLATGDDALKAALDALAEVRVRQRFTADGTALIRYSDPLHEEEERLGLRVAELNAIRNLTQHFGTFDAATRARFQIDESVTPAKILITALESEQYEPRIRAELQEDIDEKDAARKKLVLKRAMFGAAKGLLISEGVSLGLDAAMGTFDGLITHAHEVAATGAAPSHDGISVNNGYSVVDNPDGTVGFKGPDGQMALDHLVRDPETHQFSTASQARLHEAGFNITAHTAPGAGIDKPVSLQEFLNNHSHETIKVGHTEWLDNNTPNPDGNELRSEWTGTGVGPNGDVQLNVSNMQGYSFHGSDRLDPQTAIHNGQMKLLVSFNEATKDHPFVLTYKPDGTLDIPKDSPVAKAFWPDSSGHMVFHGYEAKTAIFDGTNSDGSANVVTAATIVGHNDMPATLTDHTPGGTGQTTYEVTAPVHHETTGVGSPYGVVYDTGRRAMSAVERKEPQPSNEIGLKNPNISPFYYGGGSLESLRAWLREDPNRLHPRRQEKTADGHTKWLEADGSQVVRSVERERATLTSYLDGERTKSPDHYQMVESVADALGTMSDKNRVAVNVPAWMEATALKNLLSEWMEQKDKSGNELDHDLYEVNVLVNRKSGTEADNSVEVINKFISDFEQVHGFRPKVNFADIELDEGYNNVGYARKLLSDAVALRSVRRENQTEPLYFESEDADVLSVDKRTVFNLINKLDANPFLDAVRGVQDRAPEYMKENDMLFLRRRAWDFFEIMARSKQFRNPTAPNWNFSFNRVVTGGWNTGYTAEAYGMIGGYSIVPSGEDMSVGEKITMARGDGKVPNLEVVGTVSSRSSSSPRRFINEIAADKNAYEDFSNEEDNKVIREKSIPELLDAIKQYDRINPSNEKDFEGYISSTFNWAKSVTPTTDEAKQFERRLLFWLGFKGSDYDLSDEGLKIKSWNNVEGALERYRKRYAT